MVIVTLKNQAVDRNICPMEELLAMNQVSQHASNCDWKEDWLSGNKWATAKLGLKLGRKDTSWCLMDRFGGFRLDKYFRVTLSCSEVTGLWLKALWKKWQKYKLGSAEDLWAVPELIPSALTVPQKTWLVVSSAIRSFHFKTPSDLDGNRGTERVGLIRTLLESPHLFK